MAGISVVIATKNEEGNIRRCLESVKWADEIIIVDDISKDRTVEICREYTDNIFTNNSKGSFHINKNLGIEKASGEWILSMDADEIIPPELTEEIKRAIRDERMLGYYLNRKNYFLGKWIRGCGWYPDYIIRLFRKGVTKWPLNIHDVPRIKDKNRVGHLKVPYLHYSYPTMGQYLDKFPRYTARLAQEEKEKGVKITAASFFVYFILKPVYRFFYKFFILRGCGDGFRGLFISASSVMTIFFTYAKLWKMQRSKNCLYKETRRK